MQFPSLSSHVDYESTHDKNKTEPIFEELAVAHMGMILPAVRGTRQCALRELATGRWNPVHTLVTHLVQHHPPNEPTSPTRDAKNYTFSIKCKH